MSQPADRPQSASLKNFAEKNAEFNFVCKQIILVFLDFLKQKFLFSESNFTSTGLEAHMLMPASHILRLASHNLRLASHLLKLAFSASQILFYKLFHPKVNKHSLTNLGSSKKFLCF